ncbi:MAG: DUF177 domain-containing protein [Bdellovibrionaceae bacterium]|nr:DUF177 domain-containing protein [Pseudobdellovibrionaceae bacterium]
MFINLNEIPPEGQDWVFNRKSSELNEILSDVIGSAAYEATLSIRPLQPGTFQITGGVTTQVPEDCSRCGLGFQYNINQKFNELLMPQNALPRDGKYQKANHYSDESHTGPEVVEYTGNQFAVGEFVHEVVALAVPFNPAPEEDAKGNCRVCKIPVQNQNFSYSEELEEPESPFAALKKLKI